jgi:hypothetical protein
MLEDGYISLYPCGKIETLLGISNLEFTTGDWIYKNQKNEKVKREW